MRDLHAVVNAAHHQPLFTPVKLEPQRHKGLGVFPCACSPGANEVRDTGVATGVAAELDLRKQRTRCAPVLFGAQRVGLERLLQLGNKPTELVILIPIKIVNN